MGIPFDAETLPLRAAGEFSEFRWELRGDVVGDLVHLATSVDGPHGGGGGGGVGPLPFADLGWTRLGAIAGVGESSGTAYRTWFRRVRRPLSLFGVVADSVRHLVFHFENATPADASLIDAGHAEVRFFFLIVAPDLRWSYAVAFDVNGVEVDRVARSQAPRA